MKKIKLCTLTNRGPVAIVGITKEPSRVGVSVACLHNSTQELGISRQYHDFVRRPTGLIERDFNHNSFRLDFSDVIDEGESWQLAAYAAHYLFENDLLAGPEDVDAKTICMTGRLSMNREILPVGFVDEKLASLEEMPNGSYDMVVLPSGSIIEGSEKKVQLCGHWNEVLLLLTDGKKNNERSGKNIPSIFLKTTALVLVCLCFAFGYLRYLSSAKELWDANYDGRINELLMLRTDASDNCVACQVSMFLWSLRPSQVGEGGVREQDISTRLVACDGQAATGWVALDKVAQNFGDIFSGQPCKLELRLTKGGQNQKLYAAVIGLTDIPVSVNGVNATKVTLWKRSAWETMPQALKILVWSISDTAQQNLLPENQARLWEAPILAKDLMQLQVLSRQQLQFAEKKVRRFQ